MKKTEKILIVDDSVTNLSYLRLILEEEGYFIREAKNGMLALKLLEEHKPDLILLDIVMPEMNGLDVCRHVKKDKKLAEIPIIFISAAAETDDKIEGLRLGAVDYVTKPFQREELLVRIKTHLSLKDKEVKLKNANKKLTDYRNNLEVLIRKRTDELEKSNSELLLANQKLENKKNELEGTINKLNETQTKLIHSDKMASLGILMAGVAHEINNPVNFINSSVIGLKNNLGLLEDYSKSKKHLTENKPNGKEKEHEVNLTNLVEMLNRSVDIIEVGIGRTTKIVKSLKSFARSDQNEIKRIDLIVNLENTLIILNNYYKERIEIIKEYGQIPKIQCYSGRINQVLMNILINAMQAIKNKGKIWISTGLKDKGRIYIKIKDSGVGIDSKNINKVFDAFYTTKEDDKGTGLGLSISYNIIKEHKGEILIDSEPSKGSCFEIILPISQ